MDWRDEGVVLGLRKHGENHVILDLMTAEHGRHFGLVRGGRSRRMQTILQIGNSLSVVWRARIEEQLGTLSLEPLTLRAGRWMASEGALHGVHYLTFLLRLLPERHPYPGLYAAALVLLEHLENLELARALFVRFELALLSELGFGLDLSQCAATGRQDELIYVSPKSGRAVSREAGKPWADRLLPLPGFLQQSGQAIAREELQLGFQLTSYFLDRNLFGPRGLEPPMARHHFMRLALECDDVM